MGIAFENVSRIGSFWSLHLMDTGEKSALQPLSPKEQMLK